MVIFNITEIAKDYPRTIFNITEIAKDYPRIIFNITESAKDYPRIIYFLRRTGPSPLIEVPVVYSIEVFLQSCQQLATTNTLFVIRVISIHYRGIALKSYRDC